MSCRPAAGTPKICSPVRKAGRGEYRQNAGGSCRLGAGGADHRSGKRRGKILGAGAGSGKKNLADAPILKCLEERINA
ncbi:MAG: hypothetical protein ACLVJH_15210 [Faecalibacterium prausnitzii]